MELLLDSAPENKNACIKYLNENILSPVVGLNNTKLIDHIGGLKV